MPHFYTKEEVEFIKENIKGISTAELTRLFNEKFNCELGANQIKAFKKNHKLNSGLTGRFEKGSVPFNKGKKKYWKGGEETQFKKGNIPLNYRPVGSERINVEGYIEIKVADPRKWKMKHVVEWEKIHGKIPKGHVIIFGDANKNNLNIDNLLLITRSELLRMNRSKLIQKDIELTKTGLNIAKLQNKISEISKLKK